MSSPCLSVPYSLCEGFCTPLSLCYLGMKKLMTRSLRTVYLGKHRAWSGEGCCTKWGLLSEVMSASHIRLPRGTQLRCSGRLCHETRLWRAACAFPIIFTRSESPQHLCLEFLPPPSQEPQPAGQGAYRQEGEPDVAEEGLKHHREVLSGVIVAGLHQLPHAVLRTHTGCPQHRPRGRPGRGVVGRRPGCGG